jgi:hypothetical protein
MCASGTELYYRYAAPSSPPHAKTARVGDPDVGAGLWPGDSTSRLPVAFSRETQRHEEEQSAKVGI